MNSSTFLKKIQTLSIDELTSIKGIGEVLAKNISAFSHSDRCKNLITQAQKLENSNNTIHISATSAETIENGALSGYVVCITGTFDISRPEIKQQLEKLGAKVLDNVTKNTTHLLAGEKSGSKLQKAQDLGVIIVTDYDDFMSNPQKKT